jgi:hypothetical protein
LTITCAAAMQAATVPITGKLLDYPGLIMAFLFIVFAAIAYLLSNTRLFLILALVAVRTITAVYVGIFEPAHNDRRGPPRTWPLMLDTFGPQASGLLVPTLHANKTTSPVHHIYWSFSDPRRGLAGSSFESRGFELPVLFGLFFLGKGVEVRPVFGQNLPADRSENNSLIDFSE